MIHRDDIGRPIAIMRADQVRVHDSIVVADPLNMHDPHQIETVVDVEHVGDDVNVVHTVTRTRGIQEFSTSIGNAVIVVR